MATIDNLLERIEALETIVEKLDDPARNATVNIAGDTATQSIPDAFGPAGGITQALAAQIAREIATNQYDSGYVTFAQYLYPTIKTEVFGNPVDGIPPTILENIIDLANNSVVRNLYNTEYSNFHSSQDLFDISLSDLEGNMALQSSIEDMEVRLDQPLPAEIKDGYIIWDALRRLANDDLSEYTPEQISLLTAELRVLGSSSRSTNLYPQIYDNLIESLRDPLLLMLPEFEATDKERDQIFQGMLSVFPDQRDSFINIANNVASTGVDLQADAMTSWLQNPFLLGMMNENDTFMRAMLSDPTAIADLANTAFVAPLVNELYNSPELQQLMLQAIPINSTIVGTGIALNSEVGMQAFDETGEALPSIDVHALSNKVDGLDNLVNLMKGGISTAQSTADSAQKTADDAMITAKRAQSIRLLWIAIMKHHHMLVMEGTTIMTTEIRFGTDWRRRGVICWDATPTDAPSIKGTASIMGIAQIALRKIGLVPHLNMPKMPELENLITSRHFQIVKAENLSAKVPILYLVVAKKI